MRYGCSQGHEWDAVGDRDSRSSSCPECGAIGTSSEQEQRDELPPPPEAFPTVAGVARAKQSLGGAHSLPRQIDRYEILEELGRGGMGIVYKASDKDLGRLVALKLIAGWNPAPDQERRFRLEAEAVARLQHTNIVQVHDIGEYNGLPYLSLEYVDGGNLADRLEGVPLPAVEATEIILVVASAMQEAHRRGIIHRDLKPENILLTAEGIPKIADFGLAKRMDQDARRTHTGAVMGTPGYMSPEQAAGLTSEIDLRTDVYALGAILYEMLTGRPPHQGESPVATLRQILEVEPVPIRLLNPGVARDLETVCMKCLAKAKKARYQSAQDLVDDLKRWRGGVPIQARRVTDFERVWRWCCRNRSMAALLALVVALIGATAIGTVVYQSQLAAMRRVATSQSYLWLVDNSRERFRDRELGWRAQSLRDLRRASVLKTSIRDATRLRSLGCNYLTSFDLEGPTVLDPEMRPSRVAFDPKSRGLAVTPWITLGRAEVKLFDRISGHELEARGMSFGLANALTGLVSGGPDKMKGDGAHALKYSRNGNFLAAGTRSGTIHLWDESETPPRHFSWQAHQNQIWGVEFGPNGTELITCSNDHTIAKWLLPTDGEVPRRPVLRVNLGAEVRSISLGVRADGADTVIACGIVNRHGRCFRLRDLSELPPPLPDMAAREVAFAPDGRRLAIAGAGKITLLDWETRRIVKTLSDPAFAQAHEKEVNYLAFDPTGTLLVSAGMLGTIKLWDSISGRMIVSTPVVGDAAAFPCFSADGKYLAVTGNKKLLLYKVKGLLESYAVSPHGGPVKAFDLGANGQRLACIAGNSFSASVQEQMEITVWDIAGRRRIHRVETSGEPSLGHIAVDVSLQSGGTVVAASQSWPSRVHVVDLQTQEPPKQFPVSKIRTLAFAPDDTTLWCGLEEKNLINECGVVAQFSMPHLAPVRKWHNVINKGGGRSKFLSLKVGRDWVVAASEDTCLHLFDARQDRPLVTSNQMRMDSPVGAAALSRDENLAAAGSDGGKIGLFTIPGQDLVSLTSAHSKQITCLAFSPGTKLLASAGKDGEMRIWSVRSGLTELFTRRFEGSHVIRMEFAPDGKRLYFLVRGETAVRVWHIELLRESFQQLGVDW